VIVGLVGKKSAGKDTVGAILVERHGFVRVSFADALKRSAAALFDVPVETWDALKNRDDAVVILAVYEGVHARMTVREFLQRYGTEAHREVFGGTFWTDVVEDKFRQNHTTQGRSEPGKLERIVVTDVRFEEEAALVRKYGGMIVRVVRPSVEVGDTHASETVQESIIADFELWNGGTLDDLRSTIDFDVMGAGLGGGRTEMSRALARRFTT
jgi:hypothetical protein